MCAGLDEGVAMWEVGFEGRRFGGWKEGGGCIAHSKSASWLIEKQESSLMA